MVTVELVYLPAGQVYQKQYQFSKPVTVETVLKHSNLFTVFPQLAEQPLSVGIFSKFVSLSEHIKDQDRIEIYCNLTIDPKQRRIERLKG